MDVSGFVVVDASVAFKLLIEESDSDRATALVRHCREEATQLAAPQLMSCEVSNALHRRVVKGQLVIDDAVGLIRELMSLGISFHDTADLHSRALQLASAAKQGAVYDGYYLALAESLDCELWTADRRFQRAMSAQSDVVRWLGEFAMAKS